MSTPRSRRPRPGSPGRSPLSWLSDGKPADVFSAQCPSRAALDRISDKWTVLIVVALIPERKAPSDPDRVMVTGGGYPLPPLDLKVPKAPKRRRPAAPAAAPQPAAVAASSTPKEASDGDA